MVAKKFNVIIWLVKAAELDVMKKCCAEKLIGLHFDIIYTLPYAMCLNTVSEIIADLNIEDDQDIVATSRFSCVGMIPPAEMTLLQQNVKAFVKNTPITVDVWKELSGSYFEKAVQKAQASINKTFAELANYPDNAFTLLIVNNDRMPLLELLAEPLNSAFRIPAEGEVVEFRFEAEVKEGKVRAKLVFVAHGMSLVDEITS